MEGLRDAAADGAVGFGALTTGIWVGDYGLLIALSASILILLRAVKVAIDVAQDLKQQTRQNG